MKYFKRVEMATIGSKRIDAKFIDLSIPFESFLWKLFGKRMINIHGRCSEHRWKSYLSKIGRSIEKSIELNIISDNFHKNQLYLHAAYIRELSKSKEIIDPEIVYHLTAIIFQLLGGSPDHRDRSVVNQRDDYILRHMRTLYYSQTLPQKAKTILMASKCKPFSDYHKYDELEDKYYEFSRNSEEFINWYKDKYPKAYLKIF
jgi:hypothetical protein